MTNNPIDLYNLMMSKLLDRYHKALKELLDLIDKKNANTPSDIDYEASKNRFKEDLSDSFLYDDDLLFSERSYSLDKEYYKSTLMDFINKYETCLQSIIKLMEEKKEYYKKQIDIAFKAKSETESIFKMKLELCEQHYLIYKSDLSNIHPMANRIEYKYNELTRHSYNSVVSGYNSTWKWPEKLNHIFKNEGKVLNLNQLLERILEYEPRLKSDTGDTRILKKNLSGILKYYCDEGIFKRTDSTYKEKYLYGLPAWFDKNNVILSPYKQVLQN